MLINRANRIKHILAKINLNMLSYVQPLIDINVRNTVFDHRGYICRKLEDKLLKLLKAKTKNREIIKILGISISKYNSEVYVFYVYKQKGKKDNFDILTIDTREMLASKLAEEFNLIDTKQTK